jgi:hypothetical protein
VLVFESELVVTSRHAGACAGPDNDPMVIKVVFNEGAEVIFLISERAYPALL